MTLDNKLGLTDSLELAKMVIRQRLSKAQACLDFAFQQAALLEVYSFTSLLNLPSQKVMQKLGMEFVKEFDNEKVPADSPLYRHDLYRIKIFH